MAVVHRGRVFVSVPADVFVPDFQAGDEIVALVTVGANDESDYLTVAGPITDLTDESVTVQGDGDPVECAVPEEIDLSDFEVGDLVIMACAKIDDVWTLTAIELKPSEPPPPPPDYVLVDGSIDALSAETITVQGDGDPVTCAVPEGADLSGLGFHVDDDVSMKCVHTDAGLRLKRLQSDSALYEAP